MEEVIVAIFRDPPACPVIGYTYLGNEFVAFHEEFPCLEFTLGYRSKIIGLEVLPRLSQKTLATYPELREALTALNATKSKNFQPLSHQIAEKFTNNLAARIVSEALKLKEEHR